MVGMSLLGPGYDRLCRRAASPAVGPSASFCSPFGRNLAQRFASWAGQLLKFFFVTGFLGFSTAEKLALYALRSAAQKGSRVFFKRFPSFQTQRSKKKIADSQRRI